MVGLLVEVLVPRGQRPW